jgi:mono/diheme cytochrome c family protein
MSFRSRRRLSLWFVGAAVSVVGCGEAPPPAFRLNMISMTSNELGVEYQQEIANVLAALFGTPDEPVAPPDSGLDQTLLTLAAGPSWTDAEDVSHGLYRRHCVHCHGITGDGHGPTAPFLDPYPRDYRKGFFKFKSTYADARPTDEDLHRVLLNGVPGTSMPSFALLPEPERDALVEYVKYLSIRGEMEAALVQYVYDELGDEEVEDEEGNPVLEDGLLKMDHQPFDPSADPNQATVVNEILAEVVAPWQAATGLVIVPNEDELPDEDRSPDELAESIALGRELFYGAKANCVKCHGPTALGDGQQDEYDEWMNELVAFGKGTDDLARAIERRRDEDPPADETDRQEAVREAELARDEALLAERERVLDAQFETRKAFPRNLRQGVYRGGRRRIDIFHRIHAGVKGTPMPGLGAASAEAQGTATDEEIWHIVDYVLSLPYEAISGPNQPRPINEAAVTR